MAQLRHDILFMLRKFFSYVKRMWALQTEKPIKNSCEHGTGSNDKCKL